jgi:hypothetical protein
MTPLPRADAASEPPAHVAPPAPTETAPSSSEEAGSGATGGYPHSVGRPAASIGVIWDALHPWRAGETPAETFAALRPWLAEIQVKDVAAPDRRTPLVPGRGSVPCREVLALARSGGFDGSVVLEHEARWYPDAAPIDDAIEGALGLMSL